MFTSAGEEYQNRVIGVLMTGNLSDGVSGLVEIKRRGGLSLVQDPQEAIAPSMPVNALRHDNVDLVFRLDSLPQLIAVLVKGQKLADALAIPGVRTPRPEERRTS